MVALALKQHVEGRKRAIAPSDILLEFDLVVLGELGVAVDLLFEDPELVSNHDDLLEEDIERHPFLLRTLSARNEDHLSATPPITQKARPMSTQVSPTANNPSCGS